MSSSSKPSSALATGTAASSASKAASAPSVAGKAVVTGSPTAVRASSSTTIHPPTTSTLLTSPTADWTEIYATPALTTAFTPAPECTQHQLTMLAADAYKIWLNEPLPVPNTTISNCYPDQFMTSYLEEKAGTAVPAFSPLVCPDNYQTVFHQSIADRPLYVACCPQDFSLAFPSTSTPGRPAYGGTCYSNIMTVSVTQYDNSSSSGVTLFAPSATTNQAYAHPIDGFALAALPTTTANTTPSEAAATATAPVAPVPSMQFSPGIISGIAVGGIAVITALLVAFMFCLRRGRRRRQEMRMQKEMRFGFESPTTPLDEQGLIAFPYRDPDAPRHSSVRKAAEMPSSMAWVPELPPKYRSQYELPNHPRARAPPQELPAVVTPPLPQEPEPVILRPPPRSPDRDLIKPLASFPTAPAGPPCMNSRSQQPRARRGPPTGLMLTTDGSPQRGSGNSGVGSPGHYMVEAMAPQPEQVHAGSDSPPSDPSRHRSGASSRSHRSHRSVHSSSGVSSSSHGSDPRPIPLRYYDGQGRVRTASHASSSVSRDSPISLASPLGSGSRDDLGRGEAMLSPLSARSLEREYGHSRRR